MFFQCAVAILGPPLGFFLGGITGVLLFQLAHPGHGGYYGAIAEPLAWGIIGNVIGFVLGTVVAYYLSRRIGRSG
jgi:hypothetical protein